MPSMTFTISTAANDGYVGKTGSGVYPPTTSTTTDTADQVVYSFRDNNAGSYGILNGMFLWDTSALPDDAVVTGATLRVYNAGAGGGYATSADALSVNLEWRNWTTLASEYSATASTTAYAGVSSIATQFSAAGYYNLELLDARTNINLTGNTGLRMHLSHRSADAAPTGRNFLAFSAFGNPGSFDAPQLIVTYKLYDAHVGNDIAVDETGGASNTAVALNTGPAPGATNYAEVVRQTALATGSVPCSFTTASGGLGGSTTETLASLVPVRDFTTGSAATAFTVPAGKTMRVTGFWGVARRDTGTGSITWELEMNLHVDTGATATTSSPIVFSGVAAWRELAASTTVWIGTAPVWFEIPGGIELPAGASFALGYRNSSSQPTRTTNALCVTGFEY